MRVLVTFAVEAEFAPWRRRHAFTSASLPTPMNFEAFAFCRGAVFGNDVDVVLTGIGWDENKASNRPRYALRELLKQSPDMCISSGLAGGLRADLKCGDIVAASAVSLRQGGDKLRTNRNLLNLARDAGARIERMQITETHIVSESAAKSALSNFGDLVDMESYYILQIARGTRIPAISVRAISDTLGQDLPFGIDKIVDREGHVQTLQLLKAITQQPTRISSLLSFGSQSRSAAVSLADFLDRFFEAVGGDTSEAQAKRERVAAR